MAKEKIGKELNPPIRVKITGENHGTSIKIHTTKDGVQTKIMMPPTFRLPTEESLENSMKNAPAKDGYEDKYSTDSIKSKQKVATELSPPIRVKITGENNGTNIQIHATKTGVQTKITMPPTIPSVLTIDQQNSYENEQ